MLRRTVVHFGCRLLVLAAFGPFNIAVHHDDFDLISRIALLGIPRISRCRYSFEVDLSSLERAILSRLLEFTQYFPFTFFNTEELSRISWLG